jgi:phosphopantothenoylcysteine decarboxylase/phosphopantothenate--cysteine ligase
MPDHLNITLILSGSIAAYKVCILASHLVKDGHTVQTVATRAALRFVGTATLEGLTNRKVYTSLWAPRENMTHINLRRWSDLFIFYPATANRINQLASGLAPDLLGAVFLANNFEKPFWIAPAMNTGMLEHPATKEALTRLESWGCRILRGEEGALACGDIGSGRLVEPERVLALVREEAFRKARERCSGPRRRALVTGGAMTEQIDRVRSITNTSSGRTASAIVSAFLSRGWEVDFLHHETSVTAGSESARLVSYRTYEDFTSKLTYLLKTSSYDTIVHAAAVSDYHVEAGDRSTGKIESGEEVVLRLVPNPKILPRLRDMAVNRPLVVGFKLTVGVDEAEGIRRAAAVLNTGAVDMVVWNDLEGLSLNRHNFILYDGITTLGRGNDNNTLAALLVEQIEDRLRRNSL